MTHDGSTPNLAIDVVGLSKSFRGQQVVKNLSMRVQRGQIYGFLGPNGAGKTTTMRMLCGLLTPDSGSGTCLGYDIRSDSRRIKRRVGYMTQRFSLYSDLSVRENLEFVARVYGVPNEPAAARKAAVRFGFEARQDQLAGSLSGGWKQRLALAACILPEPELLILDEPTAGVDPKTRREFWSEIQDLAAAGLTALVSTHYMDEAERCDEIAYMLDGEILARGSVDGIKASSRVGTWIVMGEDLHGLQQSLASASAIEMVARFGHTLRVSGRDEDALLAAIAPYRLLPGTEWQRIEATLDDVFIHMMSPRKEKNR